MTLLAVKAAGLVTPVGFNYESTCAALRAGIRQVTAENLWDEESGSLIAAGRVQLPQWQEGSAKFPDLVAPAIYECLEAAKPIPANQIPLLLGIAEFERPYRWPGVDAEILPEIQDKLSEKFHPASRVIAGGRVSVVLGLEEARRLIETGSAPCCIVAGVDSFLQQETVEAFMKQRRVLTQSNSNGFSPGEAGAAILVAPADKPHGELCIVGTALAREEAPVVSERPLKGVGLTEVCRAALNRAGLDMFDVAYRITDLNGEHYKFKESLLAVNRLLKRHRHDRFDVWHPIEYMGEIGAAIGSCALAVALHAASKGYAPGPVVLCHFGDDNGDRGAVVAAFRSNGSRR
jgi:3-oxoacyl-[acyl-carrier-protein] synthase-1